MRNKLYLLSLDSRRGFLKLQFAFKIIQNVHCPHRLEGYLIKRLTPIDISPFKRKWVSVLSSVTMHENGTDYQERAEN